MKIFGMKNAIIIDEITDEDFQKLEKMRDIQISLSGIMDEDSQKLKEVSNIEIPIQHFLPRPAVRDDKGKLLKEYTTQDWFWRLREKLYSAFEDDSFIDHYELAELICLSISCLEKIGYNEKLRDEIFRRIDAANERRGCFKQSVT